MQFSTTLSSTELGQWCNHRRLMAFQLAKEMLTMSPESKQACGFRQYTREEAVMKIIEDAAKEIEKNLQKWEKANPR